MYSGLFTDFVRIDEFSIAKKLKIDKLEVVKILNKLDKFSVVAYQPASDKPKITLLSDAVNHKDINLSAQHYFDRKKEAIQRFNSIRDYLEKSTKCRSQMLLEYFGEQNSLRCESAML